VNRQQFRPTYHFAAKEEETHVNPKLIRARHLPDPTSTKRTLATMDAFEPINGISLEKYAELSAWMSDTGGDLDQCAAIAAAHGFSRPDWEAAMNGWTERMRDPALLGKVAVAFMPLYQTALEHKRGGGEPVSLEEFARITAEYSFRKDPNDSDKQINYEVVLQENGLNTTKWSEITAYWTPKVNDPADPAAAKFRELIQQNSDRIFGVQR
jgi:hypothetical protein